MYRYLSRDSIRARMWLAWLLVLNTPGTAKAIDPASVQAGISVANLILSDNSAEEVTAEKQNYVIAQLEGIHYRLNAIEKALTTLHDAILKLPDVVRDEIGEQFTIARIDEIRAAIKTARHNIQDIQKAGSDEGRKQARERLRFWLNNFRQARYALDERSPSVTPLIILAGLVDLEILKATQSDPALFENSREQLRLSVEQKLSSDGGVTAQVAKKEQEIKDKLEDIKKDKVIGQLISEKFIGVYTEKRGYSYYYIPCSPLGLCNTPSLQFNSHFDRIITISNNSDPTGTLKIVVENTPERRSQTDYLASYNAGKPNADNLMIRAVYSGDVTPLHEEDNKKLVEQAKELEIELTIYDQTTKMLGAWKSILAYSQETLSAIENGRSLDHLYAAAAKKENDPATLLQLKQNFKAYKSELSSIAFKDGLENARAAYEKSIEKQKKALEEAMENAKANAWKGDVVFLLQLAQVGLQVQQAVDAQAGTDFAPAAEEAVSAARDEGTIDEAEAQHYKALIENAKSAGNSPNHGMPTVFHILEILKGMDGSNQMNVKQAGDLALVARTLIDGAKADGLRKGGDFEKGKKIADKLLEKLPDKAKKLVSNTSLFLEVLASEPVDDGRLDGPIAIRQADERLREEVLRIHLEAAQAQAKH